MRSFLFGFGFFSFGAFVACTGGTGTIGGDGGATDDGGASSSSASSSSSSSSSSSGNMPEASTSDATVTPTKALYVGGCLTQLAAGRVDRIFLFYTEVSSTGTSLDLTMQPMKAGTIVFSKTSVVGTKLTKVGVPLVSGKYTADFGTIVIPGAANPISGRDITIEQTQLPGRLLPPAFCSQLAGHVVSPTDILLDGDANTCVFKLATESGPMPTFAVADFDSGCPL